MSKGMRMILVAAVVAAVAAGTALSAHASDGAKPPSLQFLGQAIVHSGTMFDATTIGGLSSITYDAARGVFYSLSDDQSVLQPALAGVRHQEGTIMPTQAQPFQVSQF